MRGCVERASAALPVPIVDLFLQRVPALQQRAIERSKAMNDALERRPERGRLDPGAGKRLIDDEIMQDLGDLQAGNGYTLDIGHPDGSSGFALAPQISGGGYNIGSDRE